MTENTTQAASKTVESPERHLGEDTAGQDRVLAADPALQIRRDRREERNVGQREQPKGLPEKRAVYLGLIGLFFGLFVAVAAREGRGRRGERPPIRPFDLGLLSLATFRLARIVSFDAVTEPIRAPVAESTPGGGTKPKGQGARRALGELVACPLCVGVWISAALTYGLIFVPVPTRVFATIFAAAGAAEALNHVVSLADSGNRLLQHRRK